MKYEEIYLNDYSSVDIAISRLGSYFEFYNHERPHQALDYKTPAAVYWGPAELIGPRATSSLDLQA